MVTAAIAASAAVSAGTSLIGSSMQAGAASDAAAASRAATEASVAEQRRQFDLTRSDLAPYRAVGVTALGALAKLYGLDIGTGAATPAPASGPSTVNAGYYQGGGASTPEGNLWQSAVPYGNGKFYTPQGDPIVQLATGAVGHYDRVTGKWISANLDSPDGGGIVQGQNAFSWPPKTTKPIAQANAPADTGGASTTVNPEDPYGGFRASPGYQFAFDEGLNALDKSASARGRLMGGGYGRELTRYGQGIADQEFNTYANRLASLAGVGQSAVNTGATLGAGTANAISGAYTAGGIAQGNALRDAATARASGYTGAANAVSSGVSDYYLYNALKAS